MKRELLDFSNQMVFDIDCGIWYVHHMACEKLQLNDSFFFVGTDGKNSYSCDSFNSWSNANRLSYDVSRKGAITAKYGYSPFGKLISAKGADAKKCSFGFSSEYQDKESGLVYYNYRYLNPKLGRWMSRDPIRDKGGINLFAMIKNDPINKYDMLGLVECCGDKAYNPATECCCEEKITNKHQLTGDEIYRLDSYIASNSIADVANTALAISSLWQIFSGQAGSNVNQNQRYIYTCKLKWIDLQHVISSASVPGGSIGSGWLLGLGVETSQQFQGWLFDMSNGTMGDDLAGDSAWKTEDIASNALGTVAAGMGSSSFGNDIAMTINAATPLSAADAKKELECGCICKK